MASYAAAYARALADVVLNRNLDTAGIDQQLGDFAAALQSSPELREVLYNPSFKLERRIAILDRLAERMTMGKEVRNLIAVLMRNGRLHGFAEVLSDYRREINKRQGISQATVTTARPLDEQEKKDLEAQIASLAGSRVQATFHEDTSLVGGVILRIGSTVYDGSVRGRLQRLKEQLIAG